MPSNLNPSHTHPTTSQVHMCILPHPPPLQWKCLPTLCRQVLGKLSDKGHTTSLQQLLDHFAMKAQGKIGSRATEKMMEW